MRCSNLAPDADDPTVPANLTREDALNQAQWFYVLEGQQFGPIPLDVLRQMLSADQIQPDDLVWTEGMNDWLPAQHVTALASHRGAAMTAPVASPQAPAR
jgi:hypothetical protein